MFRLRFGVALIVVILLSAFLLGCGGSASSSSQPSFTLSLSSSSLTLGQAGKATITITILPQNDFTGSVTPSASGLPNGVTASFSPDPATTTATMTLNASATASMGRATVNITGVSGSVTSTAPLALTVGPGPSPTGTVLSSSLNPSVYGQPVTLTAVVSSGGAPLPTSADGESVTFSQGTNILGTGTLSSGTATLTISTLTAGGTDNITASYGGDANFASNTSNTLSQVVSLAPTTTTLASLENPANVGQSPTLVATVSSSTNISVTGTVAFYVGSSQIGSATLSNGAASFQISSQTVGSQTVTAAYTGTSDMFAASAPSAPLTETWGTGTYHDVTNFVWDGIDRAYEVFVPTALPANPAMVIMLHGTQINSSGSDPMPVIQLDWGWSAVADTYGFILVKPASTYDSASNQWNWNSYFMDQAPNSAFASGEAGTCTEPPATGCPDDAGFLRKLIVTLTAQYNVNPKMVYVVGFSSGAQMAERVGVEISDLVAAISPASGPLVNQPGNVNPPLPLPGNAVAPISVQEWHGTLDTELPPCNYHITNYSNVTFTVGSVDDTFNYWTGPQADALTNQNAVFQSTATLCLPTESTSGVPNDANDALTPSYNITPAMPTNLTGNIAVSCAAPSATSCSTPPSWWTSTSITAASESGTTVTITSTLNPGITGVAVITGMTPTEYNGTWIVTASSPTSFQYTNTASGLGAATGFGTVTGGQNTEVQFIWEPDVAHTYEEQYNPARWLFLAAHPKP